MSNASDVPRRPARNPVIWTPRASKTGQRCQMSDLTVILRSRTDRPWRTGRPLVYGLAVDRLSDASVTMRQGSEEAAPKDTFPVLLLVGAAQLVGGVETPRVVRLPRTLEIGRAKTESGVSDSGTIEDDDGQATFLGFTDRLLSRAHLRVERMPGGCEVEDAR